MPSVEKWLKSGRLEQISCKQGSRLKENFFSSQHFHSFGATFVLIGRWGEVGGNWNRYKKSNFLGKLLFAEDQIFEKSKVKELQWHLLFHLMMLMQN